MNTLVDTSVWSAAFRRRGHVDSCIAAELRELIADERVEIIGPIRQELLSGIREEAQFDRLARRLAAFPDLPMESEDFVTAARYFNDCRTTGIQGSNPDFLICAVAIRHNLAIFTTDKDFAQFAKHIPIVLHSPSVRGE